MQEIIIDTDAGTDDLLAVCFLLSQNSVSIRAITVVNGLAHVEEGARNILRLMELGSRRDIPVYLGAKEPGPGGTNFPEEWRRETDSLSKVRLPPTSQQPRTGAIQYLARCFESASPRLTILALGPHTNLAEALKESRGNISGISQIVSMGGAVRVPGNVNSFGNTTAEWNLFVDPAAAKSIFESGVPIFLVPLDATNKVPIDRSFVDASNELTSRLGRVVADLLECGIAGTGQHFYAWDPLAAVSVVEPTIVTTETLGITVVTTAPESGRTKLTQASVHDISVAVDADAENFRKKFLGAFSDVDGKSD
jgi:inosine-uridine nucleoside N-ribohydrolase